MREYGRTERRKGLRSPLARKEAEMGRGVSGREGGWEASDPGVKSSSKDNG